METRDEQLQENFEKGIVGDSSNADERAYQLVFKTLKNQPVASLPSNFANLVIKKIQEAKERKALRRDFLWLAFGLSIFIIAAIVTIAITDFRFNSGVFTFISKYGGLLLFAGFLVLLLQVVEKRLLHYRASQ